MYSTSFIPFRFADFIHASLPHYLKTVTPNILYIRKIIKENAITAWLKKK
jgi:hypothetical protein